MIISIGRFEFEGPVTNFADVPTTPGLYALLHEDKSGYMLVDIDQCENLAKTLSESFTSVQDKSIVLLNCANEQARTDILNELINEFEFEEDELVESLASKRRTETKSGIALKV